MVEWITARGLVSYPEALSFMENRIQHIRQGGVECIWLLEHPPLYTAGTSAKATDLVEADRLPVFESGRGGQFTYHGPGQRVVYVMLDLNRRVPDIRQYVAMLENWVIKTLAEFDIKGFQRPGRVGIWVNTPRGEEKIAAIGVRVSKWITYHGLAINVNPDLEHFSGIVPCGLPQFGVTSLHKLGKLIPMAELDQALARVWEKL
ncbi:MAG: lipoyl(octanoyl) transferase LipB [Candidatus Paracaedibacteraceae bacterium]|nr:lipoyl(octanoyl) transferase LipB [Candidatus Paracaedibacteraceae bacterium]